MVYLHGNMQVNNFEYLKKGKQYSIMTPCKNFLKISK